MKLLSLFAGALLISGVFDTFAADNDHIWIHVEGKYFRTSPNAEPPNQIFVPSGVATHKGANEALTQFCKANNMNTVRLYFQTNNPSGGEYDIDAEIARVSQWVELAGQNQIYTLLDNHHVLGSRWETWWNDTEIENWKTNYGKVAQTFKDEPWVLGYEVMNEIYSHNMTKEEVDAHLIDCAQRIRDYDSSHILFYPHFHDGFDPSDYDVIDPPQVAVTPHFYPANVNDGDGSVHAPIIDEWRNTHNVPVLVSEFCGGMGGNGYTYDHNKSWLTGFMSGLDQYDIPWTIWWYCPSSGGEFPTVYGPDDPKIFRPTALAMGEKYPTPNNGTATALTIEAEPQWFVGLATGEQMTLTVKAVDAAGSVVLNSNASVSISISGPGTLTNTPSNLTSGEADATVKAGDTEGTISVTATSSGLTSASLDIPVALRWKGFQVETAAGAWSDNTETGASQPRCRAQAHDPAQGINLRTAGYEYTTNGGESWTYWDPAESDEFDAPLDMSRWTAEDVNTSGGSATVADGKLTLRGKGEDVWSTWSDSWFLTANFAEDEYYSIHEEKTGDFEIVTKITSQDNTDSKAMAGILARNSMVGARDNGFALVAATPGSGYMFAWKDLGHMINGGDGTSDKYQNFKYIDARVFAGTTTYPCYLKLEKTMHPSHYESDSYNRNMQIYSGYYSTDGTNWTLIGRRVVFHAKNTQRAGLFVCSRSATTFGEAEFEWYRSALSAQVENVDVTAIHSLPSYGGSYPYSTQSEYLTTAAIPFNTSSEYSQKVRFKIRSQVPYLDYMNHPGTLFTSPEYTVLSGTDVSVSNTIAATRALSLRAAQAGNGIAIRYTVPHSGTDGLRFSIHDLSGKTLWIHNVTRPSGSDVLMRENAGIPNLAAGTYIVRMSVSKRDKTRGSTIQSVLTLVR